MNEKEPLMNKLSIACSHFEFCAGCSIAKGVDSPAILDEARRFFKEIGVELLPLRLGHATGWRCRAKLAVRGSCNDPHIGLFQEGTHTILDIPLCQVHQPKLNEAIAKLKEFIKSEKVAPYNESTHQGVLRYIQLVVERSTGLVQLTLVLNQSMAGIEKLVETTPNFWHSIWINLNQRRDNVIFGQEWKLFHGEQFVWERIGKVWSAFHPSSFAQANLDLFDELIASLKKHLIPQATLVEYYAGVGCIGLALAKECTKVIACEINTTAEICFEASKTRLDSVTRAKCTFVTGSAAKLLSLLDEGDTLLVDPPRKGLDRPFLEALKKQKGPKTLFYISCGWDSFARDCQHLLEAGWKLTHAEPFLFFPGSNHIETLSVFKKA